ncbi:MAG: DNA cytosine methyltransferase [Dysgonamonadaceae bacterium]|jgi:DNA (cytosine-5)-methyltransferase 1|nr:DNA cytosine methyltransferase [Dysgonamonadaceae bacterium]
MAIKNQRKKVENAKNYLIEKPKIISLFSGCGGLDLGFHNQGYETVWANDFAHWACETFKRNFGDIIVEKDIEKIDPYNDKSIPDCDLILGGFPCQDFSMIWKQPGLKGERGNLYKSFLRFVDAKKPKAFVAENVKGILTANDKKAIQQIIQDFDKIEPGYLVIPKLYKFAEYGVPQFRERVLIVGIRVDTGFGFEHPKPTHGIEGSKPYVTTGEALQGVENVPYNNELMKISDKTREMLKLIPEGGNFTDIPKDNPLYVKGLISHVYRRLKLNEPSKTIIAAGGGGTWGYHFPEPRALTNRERARIQSFPDSFIFEGSTTEVRRQIGNAVPPLGVEELAKTLLPLFLGNYEKYDLQQVRKELIEMPFAKRLAMITA